MYSRISLNIEGEVKEVTLCVANISKEVYIMSTLVCMQVIHASMEVNLALM